MPTSESDRTKDNTALSAKKARNTARNDIRRQTSEKKPKSERVTWISDHRRKADACGTAIFFMQFGIILGLFIYKAVPQLMS